MNTTKVWDELVNQTVVLETTEEYKVEKTGLHPLESIETWRLPLIHKLFSLLKKVLIC